jgi:hypothetical protein
VKGLNLRIYRRTLDGIALLWNKEVLDKDAAKDIRVMLESEDGKKKDLDFKTSDQVEATLDSDMTAPNNTIVMMISHDKNGIDPYKDVKLNINFGNKISQEITVYGFGQLPPSEKDDRKANAHGYGYVDAEKKWFKIPLVRCKDGSLAMPIVVKKEKD